MGLFKEFWRHFSELDIWIYLLEIFIFYDNIKSSLKLSIKPLKFLQFISKINRRKIHEQIQTDFCSKSFKCSLDNILWCWWVFNSSANFSLESYERNIPFFLE